MVKRRALPRVNRVDFYRLRGDEFLSLLATGFETHRDDHGGAKLTPKQAAVVAWSRMCIDVFNGGFEQFFYNHRGDVGVLPAADLLEELDLSQAGEVLRAAQVVYKKHKSAFKTPNPWDGLFGSIAEFEKLERAFVKFALRGTRAIELWAREHISELAMGEDGEPIDPVFTGEVETLQSNGLVGQYLQVKKGKPSGAYREFFEDGSVRRVEFYKGGKVSGNYWPSGQLREKESKKGNVTVIEWFYPSGALQKRFVKNKDGYATEPVRLFYENGQLAEELHLKEDEEYGPWLKFFEDGSPKLQARFKAGRKLIVENAWDDDSRQVVKDGAGTFHHDGRDISPSYSVFFEGGWPQTSELKGGVPHGKVTRFHNGVVWSVDSYENGKQHGESTLYWDNGRVRSVSQYVSGRHGKAKEFPKFDRPVPAVVLEVEANARLYDAWGHMPVDEFPQPSNLDAVRKKLKVPRFLKEVHERNQAGTLKSDYENCNTFKDGIAYFLTVSDKGKVTGAFANGSGAYSGGEWDTYVPLLKQLKFSPGRVRGRAVECRVLARVDHTFREGRES